MNSLFDSSGNQALLDRIDRLTPTTARQWGKMSISQMLTHTQQPLKFALGELTIKRELLGPY